MHIGLTFPSRSRVGKVQRLLNSMRSLSKHDVTLCVGLDGGDPQRTAYHDIFATAEEHTRIHTHVVEMDRPWKGMGVAFNKLCDNLPDGVETIAMFGDDMVFKSSPDDVFDAVERSIKAWAPDKIGCVVFNDESWNFGKDLLAEGHVPLSINGFLHRNWIDALGHFFPDELLGDFADNYVRELCCRIGRYDVVHDLYIPHLHQNFTPGERDRTGDKKRAWEVEVGYGNGQKVWDNEILPQLDSTAHTLLDYIQERMDD
jgi:hypothetical protein